jgi:hypothetical protein
MTRPELLSVALIAAAMLATPAMARESQVNSRHLALDADASIAPVARFTDGRLRHRAPAVGAFATAPWNNGPPANPRRLVDLSAPWTAQQFAAAMQRIRIDTGPGCALTQPRIDVGLETNSISLTSFMALA